MPMTYLERSALMEDRAFISRIKIACLTFAEYIANEAGTVPAHNSRMKWAATVFSGPDSAASAITPAVAQDPNVLEQGAAISDPDLQVATETAVNKII